MAGKFGDLAAFLVRPPQEGTPVRQTPRSVLIAAPGAAAWITVNGPAADVYRMDFRRICNIYKRVSIKHNQIRTSTGLQFAYSLNAKDRR